MALTGRYLIMPAYHQMGHHSNNLVDLPEMSAFAGAIFSPINADLAEVKSQVDLSHESRGKFETILDPQLYVPSTDRGCLKEWPYYPKDVDTADLSSSAWWTTLNQQLASTCETLGLDGVCSPVVIPKVFDDKYYARIVQVGSELADHFEGSRLAVLQTALANLPELADASRPLELASILSGTRAGRIYLIFVGSTEPRRELAQADELVGAMRLINALETSGSAGARGFQFVGRPIVESRGRDLMRVRQVF
jgi:hypothetical protein